MPLPYLTYQYLFQPFASRLTLSVALLPLSIRLSSLVLSGDSTEAFPQHYSSRPSKARQSYLQLVPGVGPQWDLTVKSMMMLSVPPVYTLRVLQRLCQILNTWWFLWWCRHQPCTASSQPLRFFILTCLFQPPKASRGLPRQCPNAIALT